MTLTQRLWLLNSFRTCTSVPMGAVRCKAKYLPDPSAPSIISATPLAEILRPAVGMGASLPGRGSSTSGSAGLVSDDLASDDLVSVGLASVGCGRVDRSIEAVSPSVSVRGVSVRRGGFDSEGAVDRGSVIRGSDVCGLVCRLDVSADLVGALGVGLAGVRA